MINLNDCNNESYYGHHVCDIRKCGRKCFHGCSLWCLEKIHSNPVDIPLVCFTSRCSIVGKEVITAFSSRLVSVVETRNHISVDGSSSLSFNLSLLRQAGFQFNRFSTRASVEASAHTNCFTKSLLHDVEFKVRFDNVTAWTQSFKAAKKRRLMLEVPSTVGSLSLEIERSCPGATCSSYAYQCFVAKWLQPSLKKRSSLVSSCYKTCLSVAPRELYLQCLFPVCPGHCTDSNTESSFVLTQKSNVCPLSDTIDVSLHRPASRLIYSDTDNAVTFRLDPLRRRGYSFDVFRTAVAVVSSTDVCSSSVAFSVLLDGKEFLKRFVRPCGRNQSSFETGTKTKISIDGDMLVVMTGASKLTLVAESVGSASVVWINPKLSKSLPPPVFTPCNSTCVDSLDDARIYLSCFMGACDGSVIRISYAPFFTLNYHYHKRFGSRPGIGVNRAGDWTKGHRLIQLKDRHGHVTTFSFGIGAHPDSSITFDMDALRSRGYRFHFFYATLGINYGSGCSRRQTASVLFRVYSDNVVVFDRLIDDLTTSETILCDVRNTRYLTLITRVGFAGSCQHAVWAGAELIMGRFASATAKAEQSN